MNLCASRLSPYLSQCAVGDQGVGVQRLPSDRRDRVSRQHLVDRCPLVCMIGSGFAGGGDWGATGGESDTKFNNKWTQTAGEGGTEWSGGRGGWGLQLLPSVATTGSSITSIVMGHRKGSGAGSSSADMIRIERPPLWGNATHGLVRRAMLKVPPVRAPLAALLAVPLLAAWSPRSLPGANCAWCRRGWD